MTEKRTKTSWEPVSKWYHAAVGEEGHYYHKKIVIPGILRLLENENIENVLDLACGQGVLARHLPEGTSYTGIDVSSSLIKQAKAQDKDPSHKYFVGDITQPLPIKSKFSHAFIILALQNIERADLALANASKHLNQNGTLIIVLNHPCFRIPRQSSWQVDHEKKVQFRRIDRYSSPLKIPIQAHPSKGSSSQVTWTFHHSLTDYSQFLLEAGFMIAKLEEWHSDKVSTGGAAKMENRSREEFPLFCTLVAKKTT